MDFFDMIDKALKHSDEIPIPLRRKDEPYWGILPRMCRQCTNREETTPPASLKKAGVKPCQFCKVFEKACYIASTVCRRVVEPLNFKVKKK